MNQCLLLHYLMLFPSGLYIDGLYFNFKFRFRFKIQVSILVAIFFDLRIYAVLANDTTSYFLLLLKFISFIYLEYLKEKCLEIYHFCLSHSHLHQTWTLINLFFTTSQAALLGIILASTLR